MTFPVFLFLLVVCLILSPAVLCAFAGSLFGLPTRPAGNRHTPLHRLLSPRTPLDCPICRFSSSGMRPLPAEITPLQ
jgi:hypothetical protein